MELSFESDRLTHAVSVRDMADRLAAAFAAAPGVQSVAAAGNGEVVVNFKSGHQVEFFADRLDRDVFSTPATAASAVQTLVQRFVA